MGTSDSCSASFGEWAVVDDDDRISRWLSVGRITSVHNCVSRRTWSSGIAAGSMLAWSVVAGVRGVHPEPLLEG